MFRSGESCRFKVSRTAVVHLLKIEAPYGLD